MRRRAGDRTIEISTKSNGVLGGLVVSSDRAPEWGEHWSVIYCGLHESARPLRPALGWSSVRAADLPDSGVRTPVAAPAGQVAAAPQTDAEVPSLILWHWKDPRPQPEQQVQEQQDRAFNYLAAYGVADAKVTRLADEAVRTVALGPKSTWAIGFDVTPYERDAGIKGFTFHDLYAVNVRTGERKLIQKKVPGGGGGGRGGGGGVSNFSPDNSHYLYYDTGDYKLYDFTGGTTKTITAGVPAKFWNTEDDHNEVKPGINGGLVGWSNDGSAVYVRDNWDVWRLPASGTGAVNITGNGLKDQIRYQARSISDPRDRGIIDPSKPLYFETYGEWTKKEGLVQVDALKGGAKVMSWENDKVDYRHARDADVWVYARQTVVKYPDWYAADGNLAAERRLTDADPQQKEVAWTPGARLIDYTCENGGGHHQGVLILPAGFEQGKKYPMLTYIYEKLSQGFNAYSEPNAACSTRTRARVHIARLRVLHARHRLPRQRSRPEVRRCGA